MIGNVLSNIHTGEKEKSLFLIAYDGTPAIKDDFDKIVLDYPDQGLNADSAVKVQEQFMTKLRYEIELNGPVAEKLWKDAQYTIRQAMAVTGTIAEPRWEKVDHRHQGRACEFQIPGQDAGGGQAVCDAGEEAVCFED